MDSTELRPREAPIEIFEYNPAWPDLFQVERDLLQHHLAPWLVSNIEHIGSTAVPGLAAKPIIDIMAPVANLESARPAIAAAGQLGYVYYPYKPELMHWFCKPSAAHRTHHLHLVPFSSDLWRDRLTFRDVLRQNRQLAAEYEDLKRHLAEVHRHDREAYTEGKSEFVAKVLARTHTDTTAT